jgi:ABC-type phosphate transport system auxiliary subunit
MNTLAEVRGEIDRLSDRRTEVWHQLSEGPDASLSAELHELEKRLERLWDEERILRARVRFGDRDEIIKRARHEERLLRAA